MLTYIITLKTLSPKPCRVSLGQLSNQNKTDVAPIAEAIFLLTMTSSKAYLVLDIDVMLDKLPFNPW